MHFENVFSFRWNSRNCARTLNTNRTLVIRHTPDRWFARVYSFHTMSYLRSLWHRLSYTFFDVKNNTDILIFSYYPFCAYVWTTIVFPCYDSEDFTRKNVHKKRVLARQCAIALESKTVIIIVLETVRNLNDVRQLKIHPLISYLHLNSGLVIFWF